MENKLTFEEYLKQLEEVVKKLEDKNLNLDEAVGLYQKGLELSKCCYQMFEETQKVIQKVEGDSVTDFEVE